MQGAALGHTSAQGLISPSAFCLGLKVRVRRQPNAKEAVQRSGSSYLP